MIGWRLLTLLLLIAAPAAQASAAQAQAQAAAGPVAAVGAWTAAFLQAVSGPNTVAAECAPTINAALASMRDAASARAAMAAVRPCADRIRAAYAQVGARLDALPPLDPKIEAAAGFSAQRFVGNQRRLSLASVAYVDDLNRFIDAVARNDRAALPELLGRVSSGGATLLDANILVLRVQRSASQLAVARQVIDLRIVLVEAARSLIAAPPGPAGFPVGVTMRDLAARAAAATATAGPAWQGDRAALARTYGSGDRSLARVIDAGTQLSAALSGQGERLTALLTVAGRQATLPLPDGVRLSTDLNAIEADMLRAGQAFAITLQTIG